MAADAGIFQQYMQPVRSVADYAGDMDKQEQNALTLAASRMKGQQDQQTMQDSQTARQLAQGYGGDMNALSQAYMKAGLIPQAQALQKSMLESDKSRADVVKTQAEALDKNLSVFRSYVPQVSSPEQAGQYAAAMYDHPILGKFATQFGTRDEVIKRNMEAFAKDPRAWMVGSAGVTADKLLESMKGTRQNVNLGGTSQGTTINYYGEVVPGQTTSTPVTQSADNRETQLTIRRGQSMTDSRARAGQAQSAAQHAQTLAQGGKAPPGYRFTPDGNMQAIPGGPADLKINAAGVAKTNDAKDVLSLLDEVDVLLPKATGSYMGAGLDSLAGSVGYGTKGAQSGAQLKALEGALIAKMPKMSGPQSDKDVMLYKQMAGQVGDSTIPVSQRQAASRMIRKLNEKHAGVSGIDSLLDKYK